MTIDVKIIATDIAFPEGPVVAPDGSLILTEICKARLTRIEMDGRKTVFSQCDGGPNGLAYGPDGALYVCNHGGNRYEEGHSPGVGPAADYKYGYIQRADGKTGEAAVLYDEVNGHKLSAPNDIVFDAHGGFYFTDHGKKLARHRDHGGVYYALPDGSKILEVAYPLVTPNGIGLSPDGKTLYVAETDGARLLAFDIVAAGVATAPPRFAQHSGRVIAGLPGAAKFDSLAMLANGNIVVATLVTGYIVEFSPNGSVVREVKMPDRLPTNLCFGGPDMQTVYITLSDQGSIGVAQWPTPGLKLHFN